MSLAASLTPEGLVLPIVEGKVAFDSVDLALTIQKSIDKNSRAMIEGRFELCEMSLASVSVPLITWMMRSGSCVGGMMILYCPPDEMLTPGGSFTVTTVIAVPVFPRSSVTAMATE